jgi:hypothetical protein
MSKWTGKKIAEMVSYGVGSVIMYNGVRFDIAKAKVTGYGSVEITNYVGKTVGLSEDEEREIITTFDL